MPACSRMGAVLAAVQSRGPHWPDQPESPHHSPAGRPSTVGQNRERCGLEDRPPPRRKSMLLPALERRSLIGKYDS